VPKVSFWTSTLHAVLLTLSYIRCDVLPGNLDGTESHRRSHEKTNVLINSFNPCILWDDFGVRHDIMVRMVPHFRGLLTHKVEQPFTSSFPRADIHELLAPDLLHQLIKGVFKDHLVSWVLVYLHVTHGEKKALEIIEDIDRRYDFSFLFIGL
jgi:hypothetical protein